MSDAATKAKRAEQARARYAALTAEEKFAFNRRNRLVKLRRIPLLEKPSIEDRFWSKVRKSRGCWDWIGTKLRKGYGMFWSGKKVCRAHRIAYELAVGPIPDGFLVCHRCDRPSCVNPAHLFIGTPSDNMRDMTRKGRGVRPVLRPAAKLTEEDVKAIRLSPEIARLTAARLGVSIGTIARIRSGHSWRDNV